MSKEPSKETPAGREQIHSVRVRTGGVHFTGARIITTLIYALRKRGLKKGVVVNIDSTVQSIQRAVEEAEAPPRRTNHPPRPPGTAPTLPAVGRDIGDKTLGELAFDHGYGSVYRFSEALRKHRRAIYEQARANGRERANANLMPPPPGTAR